ncbi:MAG: AbrB/MazE/SpoVT family DNA-binding domain-containing protein [Candidatus Binatia bacterium]
MTVNINIDSETYDKYQKVRIYYQGVNNDHCQMEKGQLTLPIDLRRRLRIGKDDYLSVEAEGEVLKLRKVGARRLLGSNDPIWDLVGKGSSGTQDGSTNHDRHISEGERRLWLKR